MVDVPAALVAPDGEHCCPTLVDGVHPSPEGYGVMVPMIEDVIGADQRK